jgi:hypothetical protein
VIASAAAPAATSPNTWVAKANAACRLWNQKAVAAFGPHPAQPATPAEMFKFMLEIRPIEVGRLASIEAIATPRPHGAANALRLARLDINELDAGIAAHRAGNAVAFARAAGVWWTDERTSRAFAALGAKACA